MRCPHTAPTTNCCAAARRFRAVAGRRDVSAYGSRSRTAARRRCGRVMMTDPSYAQRVAVRSIQTLFCYARGTEGATRAAAGANASAMRSLFILAVLCQAQMPSADNTIAASSAEQLRNSLKTTRHPSGEELPDSGSTPKEERASKIWESTGRAEPRDHNRLLTPSPRDLHTIDYSFKQRIHEIIP